MKQEYTLILIIGLFLLAYLLDALVNPLTVTLTTPYHFFTSDTLYTFPFTTASIVLKALAIFITPVWFLSFLSINHLTKASITLVLSGLLQLYSLQDVVSGAEVIPLEWAIALTLAGAALLIPTITYPIIGAMTGVKQNLLGDEATLPTTAELTKNPETSPPPSKPTKKSGPKKFRL